MSSGPGITWQELLARGAAEAGAGRIDDAIATYRSVLEVSPTLAEAHHNCGALLFARGDFDAAARSFDEAAKHKPAWPAPLLALGHVHFHTGRYADAQQAFERALALDANSIEALGNLGLTLQRRSRWSVALAHLQRARALAPTDVRVWFALRTSLLLLGRVEEAVEDFLRFEPGAPLSAELVTTGLMFSRFIGDPAYEAKYLPLALEWPYRSDQADLAAVTVSRAQYCDLPRETLLELYRKYDRLQQQNRSRFEPIALTQRAAVATSGRMRVGYLSADFRAHVMGRLMREVLAAHDRARVSLYLYSLAPEANEDQLTGEFRGLCERFVNLAERDDHSAALAIAGDEVDVLVDLMGHSSFSRPGILLWKPAPAIITHLGYHGCVGLRQIDFKLTDAFADLPDAASFQIEAPLALGCCVLPVRRVSSALSPPPAPVARRAELGIADSAILFGAFVSLLKLSPRCLGLWRDILQRVPQSLLAFSPGNASEQSLYRRRVAGFGVDPERVVFIPRAADEAGDRARYGLIDVVLDTMPYAGGDTTAAALDMGVPVVTRVGERHAERMGLSLLAHLGVTETVAHSDAEYVAMACRLANDAAWRSEVAAKIVDKFAHSDIADTRRYAACLEDVYARAMAIKSAAVTR